MQKQPLHFHHDTTDDIRRIICDLEGSGRRVRLFYGDTFTGRCWNDEWHTIGRISRSTGRLQIPLLVERRSSFGGMGLIDSSIIAIQTAPGVFLYEHALFHTGLWSTGPAESEGYAVAVLHNGTVHAQFKRVDQAAPYIAFMKGERWSKAPPAPPARAHGPGRLRTKPRPRGCLTSPRDPHPRDHDHVSRPAIQDRRRGRASRRRWSQFAKRNLSRDAATRERRGLLQSRRRADVRLSLARMHQIVIVHCGSASAARVSCIASHAVARIAKVRLLQCARDIGNGPDATRGPLHDTLPHD
jgi:hypothetical protein